MSHLPGLRRARRHRAVIASRTMLLPGVLLLSACSPGGSTSGASAGPPPAVYTSSCMPCHGEGLGGAPRVGDADAWAGRIAKGMDKVRKNSIEGFEGGTGVMPAKGGRLDLADEEITAVVDYMVDASR